MVEPDISFNQALRGIRIRMTCESGGDPVDLTRSGLGSQRRISLAIWEWTSERPASQALEQVAGEDERPTPVQSIVVYDEPDTHLDYTHQRKVMDLIREQSVIPHVNSVLDWLGKRLHDNIDNFAGKIAASVGLRNSVPLHGRTA